ncbi:cytoglobin-1-like [Protopterus annectens]|uniref:cytoglobin-1-like n=1 Tax=Protopterus annectens TaxID=7888 RepID=UPI001CF9A7DC|nr:cytoglobin-1-like [Protopterus annectens]
MALSDAEIQSARGAWAKLYANAEDNGATVLARMFTDYPETKSYFSHFKGMGSAAEMEGSSQVRNHGKKVFNALNDMVQHLDSMDALNGIANPLGKKHATQLKVDPKYFRVICDVILQVMEEKCGGDARAAFDKVTNVVCSQLSAAY